MTIIVPHGFEPNYTLGFVKGLAANNVDITVISSDEDHDRLAASGIRCLNMRGSQERGRNIAEKAYNLIRYYFHLLIYLFQNRGNVIHFTGIFRNALVLFEGIVLGLCFKLLSSRYVYTVHNVLPHNKGESPFYRWTYKQIYKLADTLMVHTPLAKKKLIADFSVQAEKVCVISIGINEEVPVTEMTRSEARRHIGYSSDDKVILFFGKVDEYKGLDTLIKSFDELDVPLTKLLISGWFPNHAYRQQILSAIASAHRSVDIRIHEAFVPNEKVEEFFKTADVLVLPYRNIYQSGVIFLCFYFGLPLIATDVGSLREYVKEGMGIITKTNDSQGVTEALRIFFEQQSTYARDEIIKKTAKYRWEHICKTLTPIYQSAQR